jgi:cytidylate kinase
MYRAIALYNLRQGVDINDPDSVAASLDKINIKIQSHANGQRLFLNGEDVTGELRTQSVARAASIVAPYPSVRAKLVALQQKLAHNDRVVMDGRDIGTHVLPWAPVKIYLDANLDARVQRRVNELNEKGEPNDPAQIRREIKTRDERDMKRDVSPLTRAEDAVYMDTSLLTLEQVVDKIIIMINNIND